MGAPGQARWQTEQNAQTGALRAGGGLIGLDSSIAGKGTVFGTCHPQQQVLGKMEL